MSVMPGGGEYWMLPIAIIMMKDMNSGKCLKE